MAELLAGRYELVDRLGIRGVPDREGDPDAGPRVATADAVWRTWDHRAGTYVAAKVMQHGSAATMLRFVREGSPRLRHRHLLAPTGWAGVGNLVLFTMPLVRGGSTAQLVAEVGPLPVQWTATLLDQVLDALAAAHAVGVVHGDVRAERLLLEPNGYGAPQLRLAGFGSRPTNGDQSDDVSAVGAMAAGLLVGLGGYDRTATSDKLERSAPLGIPAVFWDLLAQMTDGDLTAEQARSELVQTGCRPDDWSMVHDDAIVETVDKLPPYPAGWGPRGPIAFAPPGFVRNDLPRSLDDDQPAESGGFPLTRPEPAPPPETSEATTINETRPEDEDIASGEQAPIATGPNAEPAAEDDEPSTESGPADERVFVDPEDHDESEAERTPSDVPDSALAALFREEEPTDDGPSGSSGADRHGSDPPRRPERPEQPDPIDQLDGIEQPKPVGRAATSDRSESDDEPDEPDESDGRFGPIPELELEPTPRRWFRRPSGLPRLRLPDLSSLRSRLPERPRLRRDRAEASSASDRSRDSSSHPAEAPWLPRPRTAGPDDTEHEEPSAARPWRGATRRPSLGSFVRLPALPTPGPREAESLRAMGVWALLVGGGLIVAAFAVLLFA